MNILREFGPVAWLVEAKELPEFIDMTFQPPHFGEIWLYNNDLRVITEDNTFRSLYLKRIAGTLKANIDAVKILVNKDYEHKVFNNKQRCNPDSELMKNLRLILAEDGGERLKTFYFGRMTRASIPKILGKISNKHTWVFYTHRSNLDPNPGIVMIRQNWFPFCVDREPERFAVAWQIREQPKLQKRLKDAFEGCFNNEDNFFHLDMEKNDPFNSPLVRGWSKEAKTKMEQRKKQPCEGLALGDSVDVAVVASQDCEIEPLEQLLKEVRPTPLEKDDYKYVLITKNNKVKKVLLAVIGEGNLASATRTWDIIEKWNPENIILVGVAGGDPKEKTVHCGDVVIAETVIGYDHGKITDKGFEPSSTRWDADHSLYVTACGVARRWQGKEIEGCPGGRSQGHQIHKFPIASGSKLVVSPKFFKRIIQDKTWKKIHATEMEADGVGFACNNHPGGKTKMLVIKSIMDKAELKSRGPQRKKWKEYASKVAASFVFDLLKEL